MTGVRKDYEKKLRNTLSNYSEEGRAAIKEYGELQRRMEMISEEEILVSGGGMNYIKVEDAFGILEEWNREKI